MGMINGQIRSYFQEVIAELNPRYAIQKFEPESLYMPKFCLLYTCSLKLPEMLTANE